LLTLSWPAATDTPASGAVNYRLTARANAEPTIGLTNQTTITASAFALSNRLDTLYTFAVVALDPYGNASVPLANDWLVLDALGDYDGDRLSALDEEITGTLATDAHERFAASFRPAPNGPGAFTLSWDSAAGRLYTVEATPTLSPPAWAPVPGLVDIPGTGAPLTFEVSEDHPSRFYRLKVRLP